MDGMPKKVRMGRPPRAGKPASKLLTVRMTSDDYAFYRRHADGAGVSLSDFARNAMDAWIGRSLREK